MQMRVLRDIPLQFYHRSGEFSTFHVAVIFVPVGREPRVPPYGKGGQMRPPLRKDLARQIVKQVQHIKQRKHHAEISIRDTFWAGC